MPAFLPQYVDGHPDTSHFCYLPAEPVTYSFNLWPTSAPSVGVEGEADDFAKRLGAVDDE